MGVMARRYPPVARLFRPVFIGLRILGVVVLILSVWVAWLLVDRDEGITGVLAAVAAVSFLVTTWLNPLSRGFRVSFMISLLAMVGLVGIASPAAAGILILLIGVGAWLLVRRRLEIQVDPDSVRALAAQDVMPGAERWVEEFRQLGWDQVGAVGFDILGHTVVESVLVPSGADRYALVTDVVLSITSEVDDIRSLVTRNSAVSMVTSNILSNDLEGATPTELAEGHQTALDIISHFGAEPVPLVVAQLVPMVVREERADLQAGPVRRPRDVPAGPIDGSSAAEGRIHEWLGTPTLD